MTFGRRKFIDQSTSQIATGCIEFIGKKELVMKIKVLLFAVVLLAVMSACTQKTCPTYSDAQPAQEEAQKEIKADRM